MRRSSTDNQYIKISLFSLFLIIYQIMTSIYTFLPLFVGVFFVYIIVSYNDIKKRNYIYLIFIYLSFYDLNKGFYLFTYILLFFIFYHFFVYKIRSFFSSTNWIIALYVIVAYLGHFVINSLIAYILNTDGPVFLFYYFYYIAIDIILAIILFKGKI